MNTDWLKDAPSEALRAALISIAEAHSMKENDVKAYVAGKPSKQRQDLINMAHLIFCTKGHHGEPLPCAYIFEESAVDPFIMPAHVDWTMRVNRLMKEMQITEDNLIKDLSQAYTSIGQWAGRHISDLLCALNELDHPSAQQRIVMIKNIMAGKEV